MHFKWKQCPKAWAGQYTGSKKRPTIILEAVADQDCRIWHCFFGTAGSQNDINVINSSTLTRHFLHGHHPNFAYEINNTVRENPYYLADGIYPKWSIFVKTIPRPQSEAQKRFAKVQESVRKDVERCFGILQGRFQFMKEESHLWYEDMIAICVECCVILHNMIIEDYRDGDDVIDRIFGLVDGDSESDESDHSEDDYVFEQPPELPVAELVAGIMNHSAILHDVVAHNSLAEDLKIEIFNRRDIEL